MAILHQYPVHGPVGVHLKQRLASRAAPLEVQAKRIVEHSAVAKRTPQLVVRRDAKVDHPVGDRLERFGGSVGNRLEEKTVKNLGLIEQCLAGRSDSQRAVGAVTGEDADAAVHFDHPVTGDMESGIASAGKGEVLQDVRPEPLLNGPSIALGRHGIRLVRHPQRNAFTRRDA